MRLKLNRKKIKNKGFTLIELLLVLGIVSIAFIGVISYLDRMSQKMRAESAGEQFAELGKALGNYISREANLLQACISPGGNIQNIPITVLTSSTGSTVVGTCTLPNRKILAGAFDSTNLFGTGYILGIQNTASNSLGGIVLSNAPIRDRSSNTTNPRYDWIGYAMNKVGAQSGMTFTGATTLSGLGGGWTLTNSDFPLIATQGLFAYRVGYQGTYDDIYLRLDGAYPMRGNLNMGNYSINNATDVNFNGWLNGNNALLNNIKSGYISNAGNVDTNTLTATASINTGGRESDPKPTSTAGGRTDYIRTWDLFVNGRITTGTGTVAQASMDKAGLVTANNIRLTTVDCTNLKAVGEDITGLTATELANLRGADCAQYPYAGMLTDRLPQYVSKGSMVVGDGEIVTKPACTAVTALPARAAGGGLPARPARLGGIDAARIVIVPQIQNTYGDYEVSTDLIAATDGGYTITTNRTQFTTDQIQVYAVNNGASWTVRITSATAQKFGATSGFKGLAQTFCDFGG